MRRSLSQALRFFSLGSDPLLRKITQAPPPPEPSSLSFLLTELEEVLLAEDGRKIALEQYLEIRKYLLTEDSLVLLTEDGRGLELG